MSQVVVIRPRDGVSAERIVEWIERNFQQPMDEDTFGLSTSRRIGGGNPLVNASVAVADISGSWV